MKKSFVKENLDLSQITQKILPILKHHRITSAAIFGSFARGEQRQDSDIDLLIEFSGNIGLLGVLKIKSELEDAVGKAVDIASIEALKPTIRKKAIQEQIRIL